MRKENGTKKYQQLSLALSARIREGEFAERGFPSEVKLSAEYDVGRNTVRHSLAELEASGVLTKSQGRRSYLAASSTTQKGIFTRRMAWLALLPYAALDDNQYTFDLFRYISLECSRHQIQLDFISMTFADWREQYERGGYQAAFLPCGRMKLYSAEDQQKLLSLQNLIVLEEVPEMPWHYSVSTDHFANAKMATQHLLVHGRRHIGFFCDHRRNSPIYPGFIQRQRGYEVALQEAGVEVNHDFCHYLNCNSLNYLYENLRQELLDLRMFDGILAATDLLAVLLVRLAEEQGIQVPEELSIIGIDGWKPAQYLHPRISTIRSPVEQVAIEACQLAKCLAAEGKGRGQRPEKRHISLPGKLIPGETVSLLTRV